MKEFWLEIPEDLHPDAIQQIIIRSEPDTVLLDHPIRIKTAKVAARTHGADILVTNSFDETAEAKKNGVPVAFEMMLRDKKDYATVSQALYLSPDYLLVTCDDWKIIPLENMIAETRGRTRLIARTRSFEESKTALGVLELGADGISLSSADNEEILRTRDLLSDDEDEVQLSTAKIVSVKTIGTGARACVDTCEILRPGEGLLTGSSSQGLFLVEGEVISNPHVNTRPFRVNAGPISLYVLTPDGKTRYLSELQTGETVLAVDRNGRSRRVDVARVKIERRPMVLLEAIVGSKGLRTILQNAETVRLVTSNGSKPVSELEPGDEVLVRVEDGGRHFGTRVEDEMIIER